jgi:hypothetical protein
VTQKVAVDKKSEKVGNATKQIGSADSHGKIVCTNIIKARLTMRWPRRETSVSIQLESYHADHLQVSDWVSKNITYGLYLSDHSILDDVDTELVVLSGIMIQNLPRETAWHLRGTRRIGVSREDVETIQQCVSSHSLGPFGARLTKGRLNWWRSSVA